MKAVSTLVISYEGNTDLADVSFFLACTQHGIADISFDTKLGYDSEPLHAKEIVAYLLVGATDGKHRKIGFGSFTINANSLMKLLLKVSILGQKDWNWKTGLC